MHVNSRDLQSVQLVTTVNLPSHCDMVVPSLWIQSHKPRGYWPIKLIAHHGIHIKSRVVSGEQLWTASGATDGCVVALISAFDFDVIARDALLGDTILGTALCCDFA